MSNAFAGYLHFMCAGLVKIKQTGAIVPSQRFLITRMIAPVPEDYTGQVLELGAGNGALTLRLAARCPRARILACEINPVLAQSTRHNLRAAGINGRVEVVSDSAEHLLSERARRGLDKGGLCHFRHPAGQPRPGADRRCLLTESAARSRRGGCTFNSSTR